MSLEFDLAVIGAGPAGAEAALAALAHGLSVALIDEADCPGGQIYRAPGPGLRPPHKPDAEFAAAERLRERVSRSGAARFFGYRVWSVSQGFRVDMAGPDGHKTVSAPRLIAATGAYERVVPFPGWTLPGVIGLAAATILLKSQGMSPRGRVVVAGCGPLLAAVAAKIVEAGGKPAAVADLSGPSDWLKALPGLIRNPGLLSQGIKWLTTIRRAGVPIYSRHGVRLAEGEDFVRRVVLGPVGADGAPVAGREVSIDIDTFAVGHGLVPGGDIPRLLRAAMTFDRAAGGWVPVVDHCGRTSLPGLYAAGDGAGIQGAMPAAISGQLAGLTAAFDAGNLTGSRHAGLSRDPLARLAAHRPFAAASARLMALRPGHAAAVAQNTVVCRCEDVTRADIERAAADGAADLNQLKHFTRCGMGPCQGRMCGDVAGELLAQTRGVSRLEIGYLTGRPPLRPVPLADLVGSFDYADLPIPKPAPL